MACEFCDLCKKATALQASRKAAGLDEYPLSQLMEELCKATDSALREVDCVAYPSLKQFNNASLWAK